MNRFGPALEKALDANRVGKSEFADSCGLHRNQLTNITSGRASNPNKIGEIFAALRGLIPEDQRVDLAILFLEDRLTDIGYDSASVMISRRDGTSANEPRTRLIDLYDNESDVRLAIDQIVDILAPAKRRPQSWTTDASRAAYPESQDRSGFGSSDAAERKP